MNKTGGQAFPRMSHTNCHDVMLIEQDGMTLRDYFAAKAMQSVIIQDAYEYESAAELSHWAYEIADAMLEEREK